MTSSILILGGGSAGWITASLLAASFAKQSGPKPTITLIESPDIPIIGVGEATVPSIRRTLQAIGLSEADLIRECDATLKTLIRFVDWNLGERFDHPFDRRVRPDSDAAVDLWLKSGPERPLFDETFSVLSAISPHNLSPKATGWPDFASPFPYAYHLDAVKLAACLTRRAAGLGIRHHLDEITDVTLCETGEIDSVATGSGQTFRADLYIDCTGFRARLIGDALNVPHQNFNQTLLCDRAVTMQVPFDRQRPDQIRPYTLATARSGGWQWDINLQTRRGLGYVYASAFQDADAAEAELRRHEGPHSDDLPVRHIHFETAKRRASWVGNCVAIGLSDGFVEPLESSGLYMIEFAAQALCDFLPHSSHASEAIRRQFNRAMSGLYDEVLDYVNLHYVTSTRRDTPFWRAATAPEAISPTLSDRLDLWRTKRPSELDFDRPSRLFSIESHEYLLFGMGFTQPRRPDAPPSPATAPLPDLRDAVAKCKARLPSHEDWLSRV